MQKHLEREFNVLLGKFTELCDLVQQDFVLLQESMNDGSEEKLDLIAKNDKRVDAMEIVIEEECLKLLALYQPVASDLRMIVAILKINNDLERISDLTYNVTERIRSLKQSAQKPAKYILPDMFDNVGTMLRMSIEAVLNKDTAKAAKVCQLDDEVDQLHSKMYTVIEEEILKNPKSYLVLTNYVSMSRFLERIGDHSTNIAEDLLYMEQGEIFRHRNEINF